MEEEEEEEEEVTLGWWWYMVVPLVVPSGTHTLALPTHHSIGALTYTPIVSLDNTALAVWGTAMGAAC